MISWNSKHSCSWTSRTSTLHPTASRGRLDSSWLLQAGDASGTGLLDIETRKFAPKLIEQLDPALKGMLPKLIEPNKPLGYLTKEIGDIFGLSTDVIVAPGSGDNMMSALGAGAVSAGDVVVSLGTSGTVFATSDKPVFDQLGAIAPFCDATGMRPAGPPLMPPTLLLYPPWGCFIVKFC
jgi:sugar (pentulose or hexulose) kinase